jgi:hypothetical protein
MPESASFPRIAVEHTIVEAYRGQKTYVTRSYDIVQAVDRNCAGRLPADRFFGLVLPPDLVNELRRKEIGKFVESITPWVVDTAKILKVDDYQTTKYTEREVLLLCSGSEPGINGTLGRMPGTPKNQKALGSQSLWLSIEHGLGKFAKYRDMGYTSLLVLENISGRVHPSMLVDLAKDPHKNTLIGLVDYVIEFVSNENRMIVGNVWKEKRVLHDPVPFNRRFMQLEGKWTAYG